MTSPTSPQHRLTSRRRPMRDDRDRPGAIVVLTAFVMIFLFGMIAFSVDLGYISIVRSELQSAADGAALAGVDEIGTSIETIRKAARDVAAANTAADESVDIYESGGKVVQGWYDEDKKKFTKRNSDVNAVRVQLRKKKMPLMFAPLIGTDRFDATAEAIAMVNPRDIVLVVDLSGSMNNDSEVTWATELLDARATETPNIGTAIAQELYDDLGFGTFPGPAEHVGANAYEWVRDRISNAGQRNSFINNYEDIRDGYFVIGELTGNDSPLAHSSVPSKYRIRWNDNESKRRERAYNWLMDYQIRRLMPQARPLAESWKSDSRKYWYAYLDYITYRATHNRNSSSTRKSFSRQNGSMSNFTFPRDYTHRNIYRLGNPGYPGSNWSVVWKDLSTIGYRSYVTFMNDYGWNGSPHESDSRLEDPNRSGKVQLSRLSPHCPWHSESINGESFSFPPRTQPMHACRRSMIAALQTVRERNARMATSASDRVAIVTYDAVHQYSRPEVVHNLDDDYDGAMKACTSLQACYDGRASTATENALLMARNILKTPEEHSDGQGRPHANKIIILLTDGRPNLYESSQSEINQFISNNPSPEYYSSDRPEMNAPLVQAAKAQRDDTLMFGLSMGLGADEDFMGRLARLANTDTDGKPLTTAGDPSKYEEVLTEVLRDIINNAGIRLVR